MSQLENNMAAATGWKLSDEEVSVTLQASVHNDTCSAALLTVLRSILSNL